AGLGIAVAAERVEVFRVLVDALAQRVLGVFGVDVADDVEALHPLVALAALENASTGCHILKREVRVKLATSWGALLAGLEADRVAGLHLAATDRDLVVRLRRFTSCKRAQRVALVAEP